MTFNRLAALLLNVLIDEWYINPKPEFQRSISIELTIVSIAYTFALNLYFNEKSNKSQHFSQLNNKNVI